MASAIVVDDAVCAVVGTVVGIFVVVVMLIISVLFSNNDVSSMIESAVEVADIVGFDDTNLECNWNEEEYFLFVALNCIVSLSFTK